MHALELLKKPGSLPVKPVYAVFGDDPFLRREALLAIEKAVLPDEDRELSIVRFAGDRATLADVVDELRTLPFFSKRRLVIVDGADPFVTAHRKDLEDYVQHPPSSGFLILSVKTWTASTNLAKLVEQVGISLDCKAPQEKSLVAWLVQFAKSRHHTQLDTEAAKLLLELVGPEVGLLASELEKLSVYVGERAMIETDDVVLMVGAGRIGTIWKALDAATSGRPQVALELLDKLLAAGEQPVMMVAAMASSLLKTHHAGYLRRTKLSLAEACEQAGAQSWQISSIGQQHTHLGPTRVDQLPALLSHADLDIKGSSSLTPRAILEKLFITLAQPRKD